MDESGDCSDKSAVDGQHLDGKRLIAVAVPGWGVDRQCRLAVRAGGYQAEVATPRVGEQLPQLGADVIAALVPRRVGRIAV